MPTEGSSNPYWVLEILIVLLLLVARLEASGILTLWEWPTYPSYGGYWWCVFFSLSILVDDSCLWKSGIYGPSKSVHRAQFLKQLYDLFSLCDHWLSGDDFKIIPWSNENSTLFYLLKYEAFRSFYRQFQPLRDLPLLTGFTWSHSSGGASTTLKLTDSYSQKKSSFSIHLLWSKGSRGLLQLTSTISWLLATKDMVLPISLPNGPNLIGLFSLLLSVKPIC